MKPTSSSAEDPPQSAHQSERANVNAVVTFARQIDSTLDSGKRIVKGTSLVVVVAEWLGSRTDTWSTRVHPGRHGFKSGRCTTHSNVLFSCVLWKINREHYYCYRYKFFIQPYSNLAGWRRRLDRQRTPLLHLPSRTIDQSSQVNLLFSTQ